MLSLTASAADDNLSFRAPQQAPRAPQPPRPTLAQAQPFGDGPSGLRNFQSVRFPNGQIVTQNNQFGVISNTNPQTQSVFGATGQGQFQAQQFNQFLPTAAPELSLDVQPLDTNPNDFRDLRPQEPRVPQPSLDFSEQETQQRFPAANDQFRAPPSTAGFLSNPNDFRELRPQAPRIPQGIPETTQPPLFRGGQEFIRGDLDEAPTPPSTLNRVRGRPIVPEDFPGPSQAVRGAFDEEEPVDEEPQEEDSRVGSRGRLKLVGIRKQRVRPGLRVVPTGIRARQPITEATPLRQQELREEPRASSNGVRQQNLFTNDEEEDDSQVTGGRRRVRPTAGGGSSFQPTTPRRRYGYISTDIKKEYSL